MLAVADVCLLAVGAFDSAFHWFYPYFYSVKFPILLGTRFVSYRRQRYHLFMLDFCYWANTALLVYIWAVPHNPYFFMIMFALTNGPLAWAIAAFRNSLVFHSLDKITSLFIHISPPLLTYVIRWHPMETADHWYSRGFVPCLPGRLTPVAAAGASLPQCQESNWALLFNSPLFGEYLWLVVLPLACFIGQSVIYFIVLQVLPCTAIYRRDSRYLTSFRWFARSKGGIVYRFTNLCGRKMRPVMFGVFNWLFCLFTLLFIPLWYNSQIAHVIFLALMVTMATWNGANFYIEVFGRKREVHKKK